MADIKMLIMDVDGVLTDGKILISGSGEEIKSFNVKDGFAIKEILPQVGIYPVIVTGKESKSLEIRAQQLNIKEVYAGVQDKNKTYDLIKQNKNIKDSEVAFIGDDYNDLHLFNRCELTACPADATDDIKKYSDLVLHKKGGEGAVQEFILYLFYIKKGYRYGEII